MLLMLFRSFFLILLALSFSQDLFAQSWQWAKRPLVINNIPTQPLKSSIDSRGNTILLSSQLGRQVISKHDVYGNLLWEKEFLMVNSSNNGLTGLCLDSSDNIYLFTAACTIPNDTPNIESYSIVKLNGNGKYKWSKRFNYEPYIFAPEMIFSGDQLYVAIYMKPFQNLTYRGIVYNNIGGNTDCSFIAALDTAGKVQWSKRLYSPPQVLACGSANAFPEISVNENKDLLLVGTGIGQIYLESNAVINFSQSCKFLPYGMVLNGNTGSIKWAKELVLDTLIPRSNLSILQRRTLSTILSNGYSVVHRYITQDTAITTSFQRTINILNKIYLYDPNGNLIKKDSIGQRDSGWHEMYQLEAGDHSNFYTTGIYHGFSPGNIIETQTFEARKWDNTFNVVWEKHTVFSQYFPYFSSNHLSYRNNALNLILQCGSESHNMNYAYFGSDSLLPYLDILYARILDSANFISGNVFFDLNQNNVKDAGEPMASHVLIGSSVNDTVYTATNNNGFYEVLSGPGTFDFKPLNLKAIYPNYTIVNPANYSVTIAGYGNYILNRNFALKPSTIITDGQMSITSYSIARAGRMIQYKVSVKNIGTTNFMGTYRVYVDTSRLIYQTSQQLPVSYISPVLTYSLTNLAPFTSVTNDISFKVKTNAAINDTIVMNAELVTTPTDGSYANNSDSTYTLVRGSFDPNEKIVYPFKNVRYDSVTAGKQELDYTIYFQNTGNDTAFAILVTDTLDSKLDLSTLRVINSSHPVTIKWTKPNITGFYFPEILLPDSNRNELKSHGFVRFKIKPRRDVRLPDIVQNNASIYFDYNPAVKTNTVSTNFVASVITSINNTASIENGIWVGPNPANNDLRFKVIVGNINERMSINVYDEAGRIMLSTSKLIVSNMEQSVDISRLSKGIYFLCLAGRNKRFIKKLVVQ
jgi:uncharacterized repeat protein (TIGR01451 family)